MNDLPPFLYRTYRQNLHRTTTKTRKDRELHKLERALIIWPLHAYMWVKRRRTVINKEAPEGASFDSH